MRNLFFVLLTGWALYGCFPIETYPDAPTLTFKSLDFGSDTIKTFSLTATFTDGDGDFGYYQDRPNNPVFDDELSDYYYNCVLELQVQSNGIWKDTIISYQEINLNSDTTETDNDTTVVFYNDLISARIPYLTPDGRNKGLKGDIAKTSYLPFPLADTIRFRIYIYDRSLNKSNVIYTPGYFVKNQ